MFIFCIQIAIRTRLVSKSHSMFGFAICICCDTFCSWLLPLVWRSVKLIKSWQQDKSFSKKLTKTSLTFLALLAMMIFIFLWIQSVVFRGPLHYNCLSISNDTRGKFSYKSWQLFITQTSEDDLSFETDGEQPG